MSELLEKNSWALYNLYEITYSTSSMDENTSKVRPSPLVYIGLLGWVYYILLLFTTLSLFFLIVPAHTTEYGR